MSREQLFTGDARTELLNRKQPWGVSAMNDLYPLWHDRYLCIVYAVDDASLAAIIRRTTGLSVISILENSEDDYEPLNFDCTEGKQVHLISSCGAHSRDNIRAAGRDMLRQETEEITLHLMTNDADLDLDTMTDRTMIKAPNKETFLEWMEGTEYKRTVKATISGCVIKPEKLT